MSSIGTGLPLATPGVTSEVVGSTQQSPRLVRFGAGEKGSAQDSQLDQRRAEQRRHAQGDAVTGLYAGVEDRAAQPVERPAGVTRVAIVPALGSLGRGGQPRET